MINLISKGTQFLAQSEFQHLTDTEKTTAKEKDIIEKWVNLTNTLINETSLIVANTYQSSIDQTANYSLDLLVVPVNAKIKARRAFQVQDIDKNKDVKKLASQRQAALVNAHTGQSTLELEARLKILDLKLDELSPQISDQEIEALESTVRSIPRLKETTNRLKRKYGI